MREAFHEFARLRRRWFTILFCVNLVLGFVLVGRYYQSALEIVGVSVVLALVATTAISVLSVPAVVLVTRWRLGRRQSRP